jgi:hypothetical protein
MEYLYKNLSPEEFEELAQDLMSHILKNRCERFKTGKDGGIDLRLLIANGKKIIAQVKHMPGTYTSKHKSALTKEFNEIANAESILSSTRYILIISAKLSIRNKEEILQLFNGIIKSQGDIIGIEDIESILRDNSTIIRKHFKLWISSTQILMHMLSNRIIGRSDDYMRQVINEKLPVFVETACIQKALEILNKERILIVTGEPGIGKTTLSEFLCFYLVGKDCEFVYCNSIDEAEDVFLKDKKQIFLMDDFLGSNLLETFSGKEESSILRFMHRVKSNNDKYLIMNSRTTLYSQAGMRGIHWNEQNWSAIKYNIDISEYSLVQRAKILYNHLCHKNLKSDYFEEVLKNESYLQIVKHKNFNPRIIDFITTEHRIINLSGPEYIGYIRNILDNPQEIWLPYYREQISNENRWLLQTLFSLKGECEESELNEAFRARLKYEVHNNGHKANEGSFLDSTKSLLDGFIYREVRRLPGNHLTTYWRYLNPSIFDFLQGNLSQNIDAIEAMIKSIITYKQWDTILSIDTFQNIAINNNLINYLHENIHRFSIFAFSCVEIEYLHIVRAKLIPIDDDRFVSVLIAACKLARTENDAKEIDAIFVFLRDDKPSILLRDSINNPVEFCSDLILLFSRLSDISSIAIEFNFIFPERWNEYSKEIYSTPLVQMHLESAVDNEAEELVVNSEKINDAMELEDGYKFMDELASELQSIICDLGLEESLTTDAIYSIDISDVIHENQKRKEKDEINSDDDNWWPTERENVDENISHVFRS